MSGTDILTIKRNSGWKLKLWWTGSDILMKTKTSGSTHTFLNFVNTCGSGWNYLALSLVRTLSDKNKARICLHLYNYDSTTRSHDCVNDWDLDTNFLNGGANYNVELGSDATYILGGF